MLNTSKNVPATVFARFNDLPKELRLHIWFHALPGPRIVPVQRLLPSGQDAEEEWYSWDGEEESLSPQPTYFMSPSLSDQIVSLLRTCRESHSVAKKSYTLLFPASSTWFSFSIDFLYLDFGQSPHVMSYDPKTFAASFPEYSYIANDLRLSRYLRPKFDEELAKKVRNLAINIRVDTGKNTRKFVNELLTVFTGVEVLVLADQLYNVCHEYNQELVWLRGQLGDEMSSVSQFEVDAHSRQGTHELETEKDYRLFLRELQLWRSPVNYSLLKDEQMDGLLQEWEKTTTKEMPTIIRKNITTARVKNRLLDICESEDNFKELQGLDWEFVEGLHEYNGSLNLSQQIAFLELVVERISADFDRNCQSGCSSDEAGETLMLDMPILLAKIDALGFERIRLLEAEELLY